MHKCQYCSATFRAKYNLNRHQRTAKSCLVKQNNVKKPQPQRCRHCNKQFYRKDAKDIHESKCSTTQDIEDDDQCSDKDVDENTDSNNDSLVTKLTQLVDILSKQQNTEIIKKLDELIETKEKRSKNSVDKLKPITENDFLIHLDNLSLKFIERGVKGYADYAGSYPFKDKVICTDRSRKKIKYKNEDGTVTTDGKALAKRFFQSIAEKNAAIINKEYAVLHQRLQDIVINNTAGDEDISSILTRASFIQDMLIKAQNAAEGKDNEFIELFLSHLSKSI